LSVLAGVISADSGSFSAEKDGSAARIGYVPQGTPLMEELSAWDNLRLWYSKEDLRKVKFHVCYPPTEAMKDFYMKPSYEEVIKQK
jgi:ABC-type multidrug transport system ATPase subunit